MSKQDLITTRLRLQDIYPDMVKENDLPEDTEFIRKGISPADLEIKEDERAIVSYITTNSPDRDDEIILSAGADLKHYRKNPVVLFGHNYRGLPVGKNMWIKSDEKGLIAKTQYAKHDEAEKVYQYRKDGFPLAESIGFIPTEIFSKQFKNGKFEWQDGDLRILEQDHGLKAKDLEDVRAVFTRWQMLEYSDVPVPANPEALELAKSKGLIKEHAIKHEKDCECEACVNARKNLENKSDLAEEVRNMSALITDLNTRLKEHEEAEAYKKQEEYFSFDIEDIRGDNYKELIAGAVKEALAEKKDETLDSIKDTAKDVMDKMAGKVLKS